MPEVGMKTREYFIQQINGLGGYVNQQVTVKNPETGLDEVRNQMDVGLLCGLITSELLLDIRDLLVQMAYAQGAVKPSGNTILLAKDIPGGR
jgi:hypothetical protein